jgi:hypothetical protein
MCGRLWKHFCTWKLLYPHLIKNDCLQRSDLNRFATAGILASKLVVKSDAVIPRLGKSCPVLLIGARRKGGFLGAPAPLYLVLHCSPAFRTVDRGGYGFVFLVEEVTFFHNRSL